VAAVGQCGEGDILGGHFLSDTTQALFMLDALFAPSAFSAVLTALGLVLAVGMATTDHLNVMAQGDALDGLVRVELDDMIMGAVKLQFVGSNTAGSTVQPGDLGTFKLLVGGREKWAGPLSLLFELQKELRPSETRPTQTSADGGEINLITYLEPRILAMLAGNAWDFSGDQDVILVLDLNSDSAGTGTLNNKASSLSYQLRPVVDRDAYAQLEVDQDRIIENRSGAGFKEVDALTEENVAWILIDDQDGVVDGVDLVRQLPTGDEKVWDEADIEQVTQHYEGLTIASGDSQYIGLALAEAPTPMQAKNNGVDLEISVTGATQDLTIYYFTVEQSSNTALSKGERDQRRRALRNL